MTVLVRQVVFASPSCDLLRLPVRSSVAILPAAITLVQEPLVIAFEFAVEYDAVHSTAPFAEALFGAQVGAVDL
jgi:hypothetical protein